MAQYNHAAIEKKWRENWEKNPINVNDGKKEKYYCLDMFPYHVIKNAVEEKKREHRLLRYPLL